MRRRLPAVLAFVVSFLSLLVWSPSLQSQGPTLDDFFSGEEFHRIDMLMHSNDWKKLKANFQENTNYPTDFRWRGITMHNVGIRSRGLGSRSGVKPGLRVDFDINEAKQEFLGVKKFVLDNMTQDASMLKERITMLLFQRMGLPAPRETHARLYVNNEYAGVYGMVEAVDKNFLRRVFGGSAGNVENDGFLFEYRWKFPYYFTYLGSDLQAYVPLFDPNTRERESTFTLYSPIEKMIRTINETPEASFASAMAEYLDLKLFMRHVAIENFIAENDGILGYAGLNNFYLYRFERGNRMQFLVWDKDSTFETIEFPIWQNVNSNELMRRALQIPELQQAYLDALLEAAELAAEPAPSGGLVLDRRGWMEREIDRAYQQIRDAALEDPVKQCLNESQAQIPCSNERFEAAVEYLKQFARERSAFVKAQVAANPNPPKGG